jgi:hypothetical protein
MVEMRRPVTGRKGDEESAASGEGNGSALEGAEDLAARGDARAAKVADERGEREEMSRGRNCSSSAPPSSREKLKLSEEQLHRLGRDAEPEASTRSAWEDRMPRVGSRLHGPKAYGRVVTKSLPTRR